MNLAEPEEEEELVVVLLRTLPLRLKSTKEETTVKIANSGKILAMIIFVLSN